MRKGIIILLVIIVLGGAGWYFYSKSKSPQTTAGQSSGFKSFFSFGNNGNTNPDGTLTQNSDGSGEVTTPTESTSPFKQLTSHTVAGYTVFTTTKTVTTPPATPKEKTQTQSIIEHVLRYVSRNTGYVYEIKNEGIPIQISNLYAANIYEAVFADNGSTALLRFLRDDLKTIATYTVPVPEKNPDGTRTQKNGTYFPDNISSLAVSLDTGTVARLTLDKSSSALLTSSSSNSNRKELLTSPFREWLVSWGGEKNIYLQTKASGGSSGFLYQVDQTNRRLIRILGNIQGLTTSVSPLGTYVLYSESTQRGFTTKLLTIKTGVSRTVGANILPEKCVWLKNEDLICAGGGTVPENTYPDAWYAGTVTFSDNIIRIYTATNTLNVIKTATEEASFDMTNLQIDEDRGILYFINKGNGSLWQFTL